MANRLYNKQTSPKGYKAGGRVKKMGGGMAKRKMLKAGSNGNGKKKAFGMLSVKAGIDKNTMPTQADRIAGAKMKNKGKKNGKTMS